MGKTKIGELFFDIRAGIESLQKDINSGKSLIKGFEKDMKAVFKGLGAGLALGGSILAVKEFGDALSALADKGDAASDIADNFKALGGASSSIDAAKKAVLGTVSAFDLMKVANDGLLRGIPGFNENFAKMSDYAKRFAETHGRDTVEVLNELTGALAKGKSRGLEPFGFTLDATASKAQNQAAVFAQLQTRIDSLVKPMDSVAEAQQALSVSMDDMWKRMGQGVNENVALTEAFRGLSKIIDETDFKELGDNLAQIYSVFMQIATTALPPAIKLINEFSNSLEYLLGQTDRAKLAQTGDAIKAKDQIIKDLQDRHGGGSSMFTDFLFGSNEERIAEQQKAKEALQKTYDDGIAALKVKTQEKQKIEIESGAKTAESLKKIQETRDKAEAEAAKKSAGVKAQASIDAFNKEINALDTKQLTEKLSDSISSGDSSAFKANLDKYKEQYAQSIIDAHKEALASGSVSMDAVKKFADESAQYEADSYVDKMAEAEKKRAEDQLKKQEEAHKKSVDLWTSLFENAITGTTFDLADALKQVAVGFAAEMAASLLPNLSSMFGDISSAKGLGGSLANMLLGQGSSALGGGIPGLQGGAPLVGGEIAGGFTESLMAAAPMLGLAIGGAAVGSLAKSIYNKPHQGYTEYGKDSPLSMGGRVVAAASTMGTSEIGLAILSLGAETNKQTAALKAFTGKLEDIAKELGGIDVFKKDPITGKTSLSKVTDFKYGDASKVKDVSGALDKFGPQARGVFEALAGGMKELYGITEDIGGKMALVLGEAFGGSIDNARLAVQELGLSLEDMSAAFLKQAQKGQISWQEYSISIAGVQEAFKPGLVAVGAFQQAWDEFIASAGRGQAALKGAKDIGVEFLETGAKTFEQAKAQLIAAGNDPEQINAFFNALEARGIKTLEQLKAAEDAVLGSAVGDAGNNSKALSKLWDDAYTAISKYGDALNALPEEKTIRLKYETELDSNTQTAIDSGLTNQAGITIPSGSNSTESSITTPPQTNARALRSGSSASKISLHMDLRGASSGVGAEVTRAVKSMEDRIVRKAVSATSRARSRGGSLGRGLGG